jgi:cardiolipin synthase
LVDVDLGLTVLYWTLPVIALYVTFVRCNLTLLRDLNGEPVDRLELANTLTAVRIFLVPPVLVFLFKDRAPWGLILYIVAAGTDVADGIVARRYDQETALGVILDPVGDVISTAAVFTFLWATGIVPTWLYAVLVIRYTQFFMGMAVLALFGIPLKLNATAAGKVVGVVQAVGIVILLASTVFPRWLPYDTIREYLLPVLGIAFCSVIASQTVIGLRAVYARHDRSANGQGG